MTLQPKKMLTPAVLRQLLLYDPETGKLSWRQRDRSFFKTDGEFKRWNGRYAWHEAFTLNTNGYKDGYVLRTMHRAHRVAWAIHYGAEPRGLIDHINGDRTDNRIVNLREVDASGNARNAKAKSTNKSGATGVSWCKRKWRATIMDNGRQIHLGVFSKIEDAIAARKEAEARFGYHQNHGRGVTFTDDRRAA